MAFNFLNIYYVKNAILGAIKHGELSFSKQYEKVNKW